MPKRLATGFAHERLLAGVGAYVLHEIGSIGEPDDKRPLIVVTQWIIAYVWEQ